MKKAAFIGCGKISSFHADALIKLNTEITTATYNKNLTNAKEFQNKYKIVNIYNDWRKMLDNESFDFLWVTASWDAIDDILLPVLSYNIPTFFEKPIALTSSKIEQAIQQYPAMTNKIQVGYNRRFYEVASALKQILADKKIINIEMFVPESPDMTDTKLIQHRTLQNSSHIFDLLFSVINDFDITVKYSHTFRNHGASTYGFTSILETSTGCPIHITSVYNAPQNSAIRIYTDDEYIYELKPIEKLSIYRGFEVLHPTPTQPIRLYNPKLEEEKYEPNDGFKPGFLKQAQAFIDNTLQSNNKKLPNLDSAFKVTSVIEKIIR